MRVVLRSGFYPSEFLLMGSFLQLSTRISGNHDYNLNYKGKMVNELSGQLANKASVSGILTQPNQTQRYVFLEGGRT